ncbi:MAG: sugar ABC transporter permease [Candidatus Limiplasma sp.]|nr:sugar ABC transporter permease [Candidatus Limiplasma sp.]MEA5144430.1 sugar ABC transporter permease [Candidatus Limiplasma sp.]
MSSRTRVLARRGVGNINPGGGYWIRYILPAFLVYAVFMAYPLVDSIRLSLYSGTTGTREFVGFANYVRLFTDPVVSVRFWNAFRNTWIFFAFHMFLQNVLGILFAVMLTTRTMRGRQFYQTVIFIPCTIAVLVTGYLFKLMLNPIWAGTTLKAMGLGFFVRPWLGDMNTALPVVSLVSVWQWVGIPTMMFVAAFQGISDDLIEAASIEGANGIQQFFRIKLPLILPVVGMIAILTFVSNFNAFDVIYSMETADGAPSYATDLIGTLFYRYGVAGQHPVGIPEPGVGAAISTTVFAMLLCGVIPTLKLTQGKE